MEEPFRRGWQGGTSPQEWRDVARAGRSEGGQGKKRNREEEGRGRKNSRVWDENQAIQSRSRRACKSACRASGEGACAVEKSCGRRSSEWRELLRKGAWGLSVSCLGRSTRRPPPRHHGCTVTTAAPQWKPLKTLRCSVAFPIHM